MKNSYFHTHFIKKRRNQEHQAENFIAIKIPFILLSLSIIII